MNGRLGRYVLLTRLGAGGTAEVWRARLDGISGFQRDFVLKRLRPELARDGGFVARLRKEARLLARLHHGAIAQVYEVFEADGETVLVMEHVPGCDLLELLRAHDGKSSRMPVGMAAYVGREMAAGLSAAHSNRDDTGAIDPIVHRDVNPANVMLGSDGNVRLIDFGFAKARQDSTGEQTAVGVLFGKLGYLAPEQLADVGRYTEPDPRCDQFSLGVVLHEMLTGRRLLRRPGEPGIANASFHIEPPSLQNADVSPALDRICLRMLSIDPAKRFPHCRDVAEALDDITRDLDWNAAKTAAQLRALEVVRAEPHSTDIGRETEDVGAGLMDDTLVDRGDPRYAAAPRRTEKRKNHTLALCALVLGVSVGAGGAVRRAMRRPTMVSVPSVPVAAHELPTAAPPPHEIGARPVLVPPTVARIEMKRNSLVAPSSRARPHAVHPVRHVAAKPSPPSSSRAQADGRVEVGAIYHPFKQ